MIINRALYSYIMHSQPGTYALIFSACQKRQIEIGKLGTLQVKPGFYIYVGSAFGPGGLKARIGHHRNKTSRPHWHMDYLGPYLKLIEFWYTYGPVHREHQWAKIISTTGGTSVPLAYWLGKPPATRRLKNVKTSEKNIREGDPEGSQ